MSTTLLIGYGPFRLDQLRLDEEFARFDATLDKVCRAQPFRQVAPGKREPLRPDHLQVWISYGTSNASRVFLHCSATVYALTLTQARRISRRTARRKRTAMKKGSMP